MIRGFDSANGRKLSNFLSLEREGRKLALFDADGTLWRGDIGEAFFRHQIDRKSIPHAPKSDAWGTYIGEALKGNTVKAYGWLAQWNAGVREIDFIRWCEEFFEIMWAKNVFEPVREFTHMLRNAGFEVWVVTGSPRWIVQAGIKGFGITADRVIGTSVIVKDGVLTEELEHEVPYRAGKARLIEKLIGAQPHFVAGNTYWDKEMMQLAADLALAIHSEDEGEPNHESEQKLRKLAESSDWLVQRF